MDAVTSKHPSDRALSSFALGKPDDKSAEAVSKHLEQCPDCRKRFADMSADSFLGRIRDAQPSEEHAFSQSQTSGRDSGTTSEVRTPPAASTLPPGLAELPDYEIKRELGRGGMGVVYLVHNKLMGREEVLKVVSGHLINRPAVLERFRREIRSAASLHHTNIVSAYAAFRAGESMVFAMEYVEGYDLAQLVKGEGRLPVAHACNFVYQAALGLQYAHEKGMVHRDIKPSNLILASEGKKPVVKVLDFGLAKVTREGQVDSGLTREGQLLGTPDYIAPEQIRDAQSADSRADIYSLGCTLYFLLAGRPPFQADSLFGIYQAHISREADPLNLMRPEVPAELAALVAKMMAKEPSLRFQTPGEVAQALTPFFKEPNAAPENPQTDSTEASRTVTKPEVAPWQQPPYVWLAVAVAVLVLGLFASWLVGTLRVKAPEGDLVFSDLPEESVVTVDGKVYTLEWPGGKGAAKVTVPAGDHRVKVELNGIQVYGEEVNIETGKKKWITVRLESFTASRPREDAAPALSAELSKAAVTPSPTVLSPPAPMPRHGGGDHLIITSSIGMKLVLIPAGKFLMGSPDSDKNVWDNEKPQHQVMITQPFYLGATEVTVGQFRRFVEQTGYRTQAETDGTGGTCWNEAIRGFEQDPKYTWRNPGFAQTDDHPVGNVTWNDAIAFCDWLSGLDGLKRFDHVHARGPWDGEGYRLPTEAEREYACRAGTTTRYESGDDPKTLAQVGNIADGTARAKHSDWSWAIAARDGYVYTAPVGRFRPNAFGLYDMHGNVWEWCWDGYEADYYKKSPGADPLSSSQAGLRLMRGGGWCDAPQHATSARRGAFGPEYRISNVGFRLARVPSSR
jgi:formylglycine-generating enzyme required for sulfatase activity/serine/threonine protein kinase